MAREGERDGGSLALLGLWYLPWLTIGIGIDLVLLWVVLMTTWGPEGLAR